MSGVEVSVNAVLQLLLLQERNPFYLSFNIPSWSLSTLFFFYLLFPALAPRLLSMRFEWAMQMAMWGASLLPTFLVTRERRTGALPPETPRGAHELNCAARLRLSRSTDSTSADMPHIAISAVNALFPACTSTQPPTAGKPNAPSE